MTQAETDFFNQVAADAKDNPTLKAAAAESPEAFAAAFDALLPQLIVARNERNQQLVSRITNHRNEQARQAAWHTGDSEVGPHPWEVALGAQVWTTVRVRDIATQLSRIA